MANENEPSHISDLARIRIFEQRIATSPFPPMSRGEAMEMLDLIKRHFSDRDQDLKAFTMAAMQGLLAGPQTAYMNGNELSDAAIKYARLTLSALSAIERGQG